MRDTTRPCFMNTRRTTLLILALFGLWTGCAQADTTVKRLAPGVTLTQEIDKTTPLIINVLDVDLRAPGVHVGVGIGQDRISGADGLHGREDVSRYARRHGVLAAVNADFFPFTGDPLGVGITGGELFSEPWTGNAKGGPRAVLGIGPSGQTAVIDTLGFLGDLQAADGARYFVAGINRALGPGEIVAFSALYGAQAPTRLNGTQVVLTDVNLPVRASKLMVGRVSDVRTGGGLPIPIPSGGLVLSAGAGAGAAFLQAHAHSGDKMGFVLAVTPVGQTHDGVKVASLPRSAGDLPSRDGEGIARGAYLWAEMQQAVGGGPRLLVGGQPAIDGLAEGFDAGFTDHAYPRTAAGVSQDGHHLILVTVDGRQALSRGVTLPEMAQILKRYGAWNALNLDGGGSTAMAVAGLTVNSPEGGASERPVADMLTVWSDGARFRQPVIPYENGGGSGNLFYSMFSTDSTTVMVGSATHLSLRAEGRIVSGGDPHILWQGLVTDGGVGFVNQKGYFIAMRPGRSMITALYNGHYYNQFVQVLAPAPAAPTFSLRAALSSDPGGAANRSLLFVRVLDKNNAPKAGAPLYITVTGGTADTADAQTDPDGGASLGVTWNNARGGSVMLSSPGLAPLTLLQPFPQ